MANTPYPRSASTIDTRSPTMEAAISTISVKRNRSSLFSSVRCWAPMALRGRVSPLQRITELSSSDP